MEGFALYLSVKPRAPGERGIPKQNVESIQVAIDGVVGDYNVHRAEKKAGDMDRAVLLLPFETIQALKREGWPVKPGDLGENITTTGIQPSLFFAGQHYGIDNVVLELTKPAQPCVNLNVLPYVGEVHVQEFMRTLESRRGWYARVLREGPINQYANVTRI